MANLIWILVFVATASLVLSFLWIGGMPRPEAPSSDPARRTEGIAPRERRS